MKSALGAMPRRRLSRARLAEMRMKGVRSLKRRSAPWLKGSKTGMSRYTASRLKEEMDAMLPVEKKADWRRKRKKREVRREESVRLRWCG